LNVWDISEEQDYRHKLIMDLHNQGLNDKKISEYLNSNAIKSPSGKQYYPQLVFGTRKKKLIRESLKSNTSVSLENIKVSFK